MACSFRLLTEQGVTRLRRSCRPSYFQSLEHLFRYCARPPFTLERELCEMILALVALMQVCTDMYFLRNCGTLAADAPMARISVETIIPIFSYDIRSAAEMVARRNWSRRWFGVARQSSDELVTSLAVEAELRKGDCPSRPEAMALIAGLAILDLDEFGCPVLVTPLELLAEAINDE
jgi:hypothetical protein